MNRNMVPPPEDAQQNPVSLGYVPTEEERRTFKECNKESFLYRSLPFSTVSMVATQVLISKGILTASRRFGSLPKVAFAGLFGYFAGKISYLKTCQEKFKRLENSVLGDALRQGGRGLPSRYSANKSEFAESVNETPLQRVPPTVEIPDSSMYSNEYSSEDRSNYERVPFGATLSESSPTGISDNTPQEPTPLIQEAPERKPITYDELRNKNRDTYEVATLQRGDAPARPPPEPAPKRRGKLNQYGDELEE